MGHFHKGKLFLFDHTTPTHNLNIYDDKANGNPVLFIPGNAGSSHQARSIASSAARQFYASPGVVNAEFATSRSADIFTGEYVHLILF